MTTVKRAVCMFLMAGLALSGLAGESYYVSTNGVDGVNDGKSWTAAYRSISNAVAQAVDGDEVVVSNGTYVLTTHIVIDKALTVRSVNGADVTTLDGNDATRVFFINNASAVVNGFTIKRGLGSIVAGYGTSGVSVGGGVLLNGGLLANCSVLTNKAAEGAGVYFVGASSVVSNCLVQGNEATAGGGGLGNASQSGGRLYGNKVFRNKAGSAGGAGVLINYGYMENNTVAYNTQGGGLRQRGGTNRNSLVYRNTSEAGNTGGGVYVSNGGLVENNTVVFNNGGTSGSNTGRSSGLRANQDGAADTSVIRNTVVWGNVYLPAGGEVLLGWAGQMTYSCWPTGSGTGNITNNPQLVNAATDNFKLGALSPCLNMGLNQGWMTGATDVEGNDRIINTTVDMGAYERPNNLAVGFTASVNTGFAPLEVVFTSVVVGDINGLTYRWSFTDGGVTTDLQGAGLGTVTNVYGAGAFTVAVTVSNANAEVAAYTLPTPISVGVPNTYAAPDGGNIAPYDTWEKAAQSIASALAYSTHGTTLTVSNGTYTLSQQLVVERAITMRSLDGADVTTLDGNTATRVIRIAHAGAVVDGFTIRSGVGSVAPGYGSGGGGVYTVGGGILLEGGLLANCHVQTNSAQEGAGVYFVGSASVVSNCLVQGNTASRYGGGLANTMDSILGGGKLFGNIIQNNFGSENAGGVWIDNGIMENNVVAFNTGSTGIRQRGGTNRNSLVYRNTANVSTGGGIYVSHAGLVENATVAYNNGGTGGPDPLNRSSGLRAKDVNDTSIIRNTIVLGNMFVGSAEVLLEPTVTMTYSCWTNGTSGTGNISTDPQFKNALAGDFMLKGSSLCINKGTNQAWMIAATDVAGNARVIKNRVDMGALEAPPPAGTLMMLR